jgi:YrbI family 3-deoxy-D-manno-octulosonate 8-phosphate phosphatase
MEPKIDSADWKKIKLIVFDFDGVMTDNKVIVDENGKESVRCDRGDGLGVEYYKKKGGKMLVISKEKNKVVEARCKKLGIRVFYGVDSKLDLFKQEVKKLNLTMQEVCYIGNDVNDLECIKEAGIGVAVNDSYPEVKKIANYITTKKGGKGAFREIIELILYAKDISNS